jgi:hypothetical protein
VTGKTVAGAATPFSLRLRLHLKPRMLNGVIAKTERSLCDLSVLCGHGVEIIGKADLFAPPR